MRDAIVRRHGFRVLRFWASDVRYNTDEVMDQIIRALEESVSIHRRVDHVAPRLGHTSPP